jgi:hypothetical protein
MLTAFTSKHTLAGCHGKRTHTLLLLQSSVPRRVDKQGPPNSPPSSDGRLPARPLRPGGPRRGRPHERHRRHHLREGHSVTICAAVMCMTDEGQEILLSIGDRMLTWGGAVESETRNQTKFFAFPTAPGAPTKIVALASGDINTHAAIAERTHQEMLRAGITSVPEVARLYSDNFGLLRRKRAESRYLHPLSLDFESFIASQRRMHPSEVARISECLQHESLGVEVIITGVDSGGLHIYSVGAWREDAYGVLRETSEATCYNASGFHAIGGGAEQFQMQFALMGYDRAWPLLEAILLASMAKKRAEAAPGVGKVTDLIAIRGDIGLHQFGREAVETIEQFGERFEREVNGLRLRTVEAMRQRVKIVIGTPPAEVAQTGGNA